MATDLEIVRDRLFDVIVAQTPAPALGEAHAWAASLDLTGLWADVDYTRAAAAGGRHLQRLQQMALLALDASGADELRHAVARGLDAWLRLDPEDPNWWHNQIDFPTRISRLLVVTRSYLPRPLFDAALDRSRRAWPPVWHARTGQNLIYQARVAVAIAALTNDELLAREAFAAFESILVVGDGEGIQPDFSFHQHGPYLNNGGYGREFSADVASAIRIAHGTTFAFKPASVATFVCYLLDGSRWMVRGPAFDFTAMGRSIERPGVEHYGLDLLPVLDDVLAADPPRGPELEAFRGQLRAAADGERHAASFAGNKHFWRSDFMAHHRPAFSASIKMSSVRTRPMEICTNEGERHYHVSDGVTPIMQRGDEYARIYSHWDWRRLPGLTAPAASGPFPAFDNATIRGATRMVGGVSDGSRGVCCFDYDRDGLRARKSWFCFDAGIVALGAGITANTDLPVRTTLNQTWWNGTCVCSDGGELAAIEDAETTCPHASWVWHDGVLYHLLDPAPLIVTRQPVGDRAIFCASIDHGPRPDAARYAYAVQPDTPQPARAEGPDLPWRILANGSAVQAVADSSTGTIGATFYEPAPLAVDEALTIEPDRPVVLLVQRRPRGIDVTLADPTQESAEATLWLTLNGIGFSRSVKLPRGPLAGSGVAFAVPNGG